MFPRWFINSETGSIRIGDIKMKTYILTIQDEDSGATMASYVFPEVDREEIQKTIEKIIFGRD